jgi:DNA-binding CsgD family transcriptional regulator
MRLLFVLSLLISLCCFKSKAQDSDVKTFIKAWQISDTSQTHEAEKTYKKIKLDFSLQKCRQIIKELYAYLEKNPDDRLRTRIILFDLLGDRDIPKAQKLKKMKVAIQLASKLKDEQLLAEVYALAGQLDYENGFLLYNLKALELQKKIGYQHFSFVHNRLFNISMALYRTDDYRQSINYGLQCLKFKNVEVENWDPRVYIFQLDMIGASYKLLKQYDSARYYYQQIIDTLQRKPDIPRVQELWLGIAGGNIGHILALQGKEDQAIPLITKHLQVGIKWKSWNNAAMAQNTLAKIDLKHGQYQNALNGFKAAYGWAIQSKKIREMVAASKGLAEVYRLTNRTDSAFRYYSLYHQHLDTLTAEINRSRLSAINAKIAFDDAQSNLEKANNVISNQKQTRNFILIGIVLLTIIALLFYNRKMLQQKHLAEETMRKQKLAEQEAQRAKAQITSFTANIIEKDNLIQKLQRQVNIENEQVTKSLLNYTLITDSEWEKFRLEFFMAYPLFLPALQEKIPLVNPAEERLATLLYLKLTTNQIANTLGISKDSVGRSKRRLKQRLSLSADDLLEEYLSKLV